MSWIESHQELGRHPKTRRAAKLLDVSRPAVIGHLHYLWWWALDFAQDGVLSSFDHEEIAEAALWDGDPAVFVDALLSAGFLEMADGKCVIHDWDEYAGKLIERREANAEKQRRWRDRQKIAANESDSSDVTHPSDDSNESHNGYVPVTSPQRNGATVPNRTLQNQTRPNQESECISPSRARARDEAPAHTHTPPASVDREPSHPPPRTPVAADVLTSTRMPKDVVEVMVASFAEAVGHEPQTRPERVAWQNWLSHLPPGTSPDELKRRALVYRMRFGQARDGSEIALTPKALVEHWSELEGNHGNDTGHLSSAVIRARADADNRQRADRNRLAAEKRALAGQILIE